MSSKTNSEFLTRRDFIKAAATAGAVGLTAANPVLKRVLAAETTDFQRSKVVLIRHRNVLDKDDMVDNKIISRMLDEAVMELTGQPTPKYAWDSLLNPGDMLGIKSNVWRFLHTPPELEKAIVDRAMGIGIHSENIEVEDRAVLSNPVFDKATALINIRPLRTHHWSGVGGCIKNYIMFDPYPPKYHPDSCESLAKLFELPAVKGKTRLHILVMLSPLFHGKGPHHFNKKYTWKYSGMLVGRDPVALDATGVRILGAKRNEVFQEEVPFTVSTKHIRAAEEHYGLGYADPAKIDLVKMGWEEDILI